MSEKLTPEKERSRKELEALYGKVWDTDELTSDFEVKGFMAPYVVCVNRETGKIGSLMFSHLPRFYYSWKEDK